MNLPFPFETPKDDWKPRKRLGRDESLTKVEQEILDSFDVMEQRQTYATEIAVRGYNIAVFTAVMCLLMYGPEWAKAIQKKLVGGANETLRSAVYKP